GERRDPCAQRRLREACAQQLERLGVACRRKGHHLIRHGSRIGQRRKGAAVGAEDLAHEIPCGCRLKGPGTSSLGRPHWYSVNGTGSRRVPSEKRQFLALKAGYPTYFSGGPMVTVSLPTPSISPSSLSPATVAATPAGVPVMMMSPGS